MNTTALPILVLAVSDDGFKGVNSPFALERMLRDAHTMPGWVAHTRSSHPPLPLQPVPVAHLEAARAHLHQGDVALVLLDCAAATGTALAWLQQLIHDAPDVPVMVLACQRDEPLALQALEQGAADYFIKEHLHGKDLVRSIYSAIERTQLQQALQQQAHEMEIQEARFRSIIEKNADGIIIVDQNGIVRFVNPAGEALLGFRAEQLVGEMFGFPVVAGENIELDVLHRDGSTAVAQMRVMETRWEGATAYVATLRDITEHKRIEEALERLRHQNELILQAAGEGIYGLDVHGNTTFVNPAAVAMLGYTAAELIGQSLHKKIHYAKVDGTPYPWEASPISLTFQHQTIYAVDDEVFWRKDGSCFPVEYISTPMFERGHLVGVVVTFRDITARKQEEMRQATQFAVTQVLAQSETLFEAIPRVLQVICEHVGWELSEMWRLNADSNVLQRSSIWHGPLLTIADLETASRALTCVPGEGLPGRVWASRQPEWVCDITIDEIGGQTAAAIEPPLFAACAFPILNGREVIGVITFFSRNLCQPDENLFSMMADIGNQIGQFIARRQAEETRWRYAARLEVLSKIDRSILAAQSPEEIADATLGHLRQLVGCQHVSLSLFDMKSHEAVVISTDMNGHHQVKPGKRIPLPVDDRIAETWQESFWQRGELDDLGEQAFVKEHLIGDEIHSYICVPLVSRGSLIGALTLGASTQNAFNKENSEIAREVANQLAIAVQQARLFEQVRAGRERLQILSRQLMEAQEAERHRIARELHDEIGQALTAVKISMQAVMRSVNSSNLENQLEESINIVDRALQQVRDLSLDLRPSLLDDLGLAAALRWYVDRQARLAGFVAEFGVELGESRLPPGLETACFRVAQEALTNVVRHARARRVRVEVRQHEQELLLLIRDDGVGFDVRAAQERAVRGTSMGLLGMQERVLLAGGQIRIESGVARGTEIQVYFPMK